MIENRNCLQWKKGPWIPCRGIKMGESSDFFPDSRGRCPFSKCVAASILSRPDLLTRIISIDRLHGDMSDKLIRSFVFHALCPGTNNPNADEHAIKKYTVEKPFHPYYTEST